MDDPSLAQILLSGGRDAAGGGGIDSNGVPFNSAGEPVYGRGGGPQATQSMLGLSAPSAPAAASATPAVTSVPAPAPGGPPATQDAGNGVFVPQFFGELPPEVAKSSAFYQNPEKFAAYGEGGLPDIFDRSKNPSTGWFRMMDYGTGPHNEYQTGSNFWSTNDWRLLGDDPNLFMINGTIIDRSKIDSSLNDARSASRTGLASGGNLGYPFAFTTPGWQGSTSFGYPGAKSGWMSTGPTGIT